MQTESLLAWLHLVTLKKSYFFHKKEREKKKKMSLIPSSRPLEFQSARRAQGKLNEDTAHNSPII